MEGIMNAQECLESLSQTLLAIGLVAESGTTDPDFLTFIASAARAGLRDLTELANQVNGVSALTVVP